MRKTSKKGKVSYDATDKRAYWCGYSLGLNGFGVNSKEVYRILDEIPGKNVQSLVNGVLRGIDRFSGRKK